VPASTMFTRLRTVEFLLLGRFDIRGDEGEPVAVGRRRERTLLAVLLLEAGRAVSIDRLVSLLWDDDPPATRAPRCARTRLGCGPVLVSTPVATSSTSTATRWMPTASRGRSRRRASRAIPVAAPACWPGRSGCGAVRCWPTSRPTCSASGSAPNAVATMR
jgi:hypothetical protein